MTKLLDKAFQEASKLPEMTQNALAKWLMEEMEDEKEWEAAFAETEDILERLADNALLSDKHGKTNTLDIVPRNAFRTRPPVLRDRKATYFFTSVPLSGSQSIVNVIRSAWKKEMNT